MIADQSITDSTAILSDGPPEREVAEGFWADAAVPPAHGPVDGRAGLDHAGWYFLGTTDEHTSDISAVTVGDRRLMLVRTNGELGLFDATCPHRGAHLPTGGVVRDRQLICAFHGKTVQLGSCPEPPRLGVARYPLLQRGELLFGRLSDDVSADREFSSALDDWSQTHSFFGGSVAQVAVDSLFVVENAFDVAHFVAVHQVPRADLHLVPDHGGPLVIDGHLEYTAPRWARVATGTRIRHRFRASAHSPTLVVTEVGERPDHHLVITGSVPTATGCTVRVGYGISVDPGTGEVNPERLRRLREGGVTALSQDIPIWEGIDDSVVPLYDVRDAPVQAYRRWCAEFPRRSPAPVAHR